MGFFDFLSPIAGLVGSVVGGKQAANAQQKAQQNAYNYGNQMYQANQGMDPTLTGMGTTWNTAGLGAMGNLSDYLQGAGASGGFSPARAYGFDTTMQGPAATNYMQQPFAQEDVNAEFARDPYGIKKQYMDQLAGGGMLQASNAPAAVQQQKMVQGQIAQLKRDPALAANPAALARAIQQLQSQANSSYLQSVQGNIGGMQQQLLGTQQTERGAAANRYGQDIGNLNTRLGMNEQENQRLSQEQQAMLQARAQNASNLNQVGIANMQGGLTRFNNLGSLMLGQAQLGAGAGQGYYGQGLQGRGQNLNYFGNIASGGMQAGQNAYNNVAGQYGALGQGLGNLAAGWAGRGGNLGSNSGYDWKNINAGGNWWDRPTGRG